MELKEFVKKVIMDLDQAVSEANAETKREIRFKGVKEHRTALEFDVAVTVESTASGKAGGEIKVWGIGQVGAAGVTELEDKIVGYLVVSIYHHSFRKENPIAELDNMYIEEKFRGKGIGTQLVAEAKRKAKEKGARTLKVEAAAQNEKALSFYRACGFEDFDIILQMSL
jgi:ribosomal protein S18 acetylase RimI-like enzyme